MYFAGGSWYGGVVAVRCAKPGCADHAKAWFLMARAGCTVQVHDAPVEGSIALCASHLERFSLPAGWSFERPVPVSTPAARPAPESPESDAATRRPWFSTVAPSTEQVPVAGGLLARAFNGPQPVN